MPRYQVTLDGKTFVLEGDRPPTEDEAREAFGAHMKASAPEPAAAPAEERSVGGFLGNVASSGGRFLKDTAQGIAGGVKFLADIAPGGDPQRAMARADEARELFGKRGEIASAAGSALKNRYGGIAQIKNTLYTDPVGVLGDVSTVAGGVGLGAKAGGLSKIARLASGVRDATNPARMLSPIATAVEYATAGAMRPMLKPSKILRRQQDAPLEIERTALKTGAVTEGSAARQQRDAVNRATEAAAQATSTVPRGNVTAMPKSLGKVEQGLSHDSDLAALADLETDATRSLPADIAPSDLLSKRRHLDRELNAAFRAAERGGAPTGIKQAGQKEMLGNIRGALRQTAPAIKGIDDEARRLGMVRSAIEESKLRAGDIPMGAALLGGGLAAGGIPGAGVLGALFGLGRTFPQIPLAIGSVPVRAAAAAAKPGSIQAALMARLLGQQE